AIFLSSLLAWVSPSINWFYPIFGLAGIANVSMWTIAMTMTVDFAGNESERPMYIGISQTLTAPATIFAPIIGGWIVDTSGFIPTFAISIVLSLLMIGILVFIVKDPRKIRRVENVNDASPS
ncbi:MAG: MFS transporter, partial [Anaerolineales bacterium]